MPGSAIVSGNGVVLIEIPAGGNTGEVLTKLSNDDFDFDWAPGGGGGGAPTNAQYVVLAADATLTDERILTAGGGITIVDGGAGNPVTVSVDAAAIDHNALLNLAVGDVHTQYLLLAGRAGGQTAFGGTLAGNRLVLQGSTNANLGLVEFQSPVVIDNPIAAGVALSPYAFSYNPTETYAAGFIGGAYNASPAITFNNALFIWEGLRGAPNILSGVAPSFAAFTLFQALPTLRTVNALSPLNTIVLNGGPSTAQEGGGVAATTAAVTVISATPQTRATGAFGTMSVTNQIAVRWAPTFSTVGTSVVNLGTMIGLELLQPAVALFQPSLGTENMTAYYGVNMGADFTFGPATAPVSVVRSLLNSGTNKYFLDHLGNARSRLRGNLEFDVDVFGVVYGASGDWSEGWAATGFKFEQQNGGIIGQFQKSFPATDRMLMNWTVDTELTINCVEGFSLGAQSGANGNQFGNFVTSARTIGVAGDWADFLLTQAGSLTVGGLAMGRVSAWVINPVSYANSTGSVANADTLTVGGFPTSSPGVTITERQSLFVIAGRSRHAAVMSFDPISPATLAAGATQDYAGLLTGTANNGMRHLARLSGDGAGTSALGGIDATSAQDGDTFKLVNVSANNVTLNHQDVGSVAANRIISPTGANFVLGPDESCEIYYDVADTRWRILYGSGA
jgi:hypothetical protein